MVKGKDMKRMRRSIGALLIIAAIIVMQLPVGTAEAADSAAFRYDGSTLLSYQGTDKTVTIPSDITVIGSSAFEDNLTMEKVVFPKTLKRIKPYAFWGCNGLKEIQFGAGLKEIGDYSFTSCQGLEGLSIPSNITSIGIRAFADCVHLSSITIPSTVTFIHETAFDGCKQLVIRCEEGSYADKYARDFYRRQALKEEYEGIDAPDAGGDATDTSQAETERGTVEELLGSTSVVGNQAVFLIDNRTPTVYQGFITRASDMDYPVKYRLVGDSVIADQAYYKDQSLQSIVLPEGIREIGEFAFARSAAESLYLPEGVEKISFGAFYHADQLRNVTLSNTVRKVEPYSFQYTAWVEDFMNSGAEQGDFLISGGVLVAYRGQKEQIEIPEGVRVIAAQCFQGRNEIQKVLFPSNLTDIGEAAFEGCANLKEVEWKNGILTIGDRAFSGCPLVEVTVPGTIKELGLGAFEQSTELRLLGKEPIRTHETSAERLTNESYRFAEADPSEGLLQGGSVLTVGMTGARANLSGAARPYVINLSILADEDARQRAALAMAENIGRNMRKDAVILHLALTDDSGIPITRLGKQLLELGIPVPEGLEGREISAYQYDRNGQLEPAAIRYVRSGDQEFLLLEMTKIYDYVLEGTENMLSEDMLEDLVFTDRSDGEKRNIALAGESKIGNAIAKEVTKAVTPIAVVKWSCGAVLLFAGLFLALSKVR